MWFLERFSAIPVESHWNNVLLKLFSLLWQRSFSFPGRLRPKPKSSVWYYRYIGRYRSLSARGLGQYVGRMKGKKKVYECARRTNKLGYRAFALRNGGDCYVSRYKRRYSAGKRRVFGRFKGSSGGPRVIDAYVVGKGIV